MGAVLHVLIYIGVDFHAHGRRIIYICCTQLWKPPNLYNIRDLLSRAHMSDAAYVPGYTAINLYWYCLSCTRTTYPIL